MYTYTHPMNVIRIKPKLKIYSLHIFFSVLLSNVQQIVIRIMMGLNSTTNNMAKIWIKKNICNKSISSVWMIPFLYSYESNLHVSAMLKTCFTFITINFTFRTIEIQRMYTRVQQRDENEQWAITTTKKNTSQHGDGISKITCVHTNTQNVCVYGWIVDDYDTYEPFINISMVQSTYSRISKCQIKTMLIWKCLKYIFIPKVVKWIENRIWIEAKIQSYL